MYYQYGFKNNHFVIEKKNSNMLNLYQDHEYLFDKELSKKVATCIYKYMQVADFTYKEKYKKQLNADYEYLKNIGSE